MTPAPAPATINGKPAAEVLGQAATFVEKGDGVDASAIRIEAGALTTPGTYTVEARAGDETKSVIWEVYGTPRTRPSRRASS